MSLGHHLRNWRFSWGSASNDLGLLPYARRFFISLPCGRSVSNEMHMIESIAVCSPNDKARLPLDSRSRHAIQYCSISRLTGDALETHREGGKKKKPRLRVLAVDERRRTKPPRFFYVEFSPPIVPSSCRNRGGRQDADLGRRIGARSDQ